MSPIDILQISVLILPLEQRNPIPVAFLVRASPKFWICQTILKRINFRVPYLSGNFLTSWTSQSRSHVTTDGRSVSLSRYRTNSGTCDQIWLSVRRLSSENCCLVSVGRRLWREVRSVICHSQSIVIYQNLHQAFTLHVFYSSAMYIQYVQSFFQSRLGKADYALLVIISSNFRSSLEVGLLVVSPEGFYSMKSVSVLRCLVINM
jgi:hypothetical protein